MIRVLHYLDSLDWKGEEQVIMNYYRHINTSEVQFDFATRSSQGCRFEEEIQNKGGHIYYLPSREKHPIKYIKTFRKILNEHKYSIVHLNKSSASMAIDAMICKFAGIKTVIGHSHNTFCSALPLHRFCKLFVNGFIDYRFACSVEAGHWCFGKKADITVINNAVDIQKFTYKPCLRDKIRKEFELTDEFVLGFVGRLENQKNPLRLIDIFNRVLSIKKNAVLLIVGDGSEKVAMQEKIRAYGIENRVIFAGFRNDVPDLYSAFDTFILPSVYEGLGMVLMEAQTNGLYSLASDVVPAPDITNRVRKLSLDEPDEVWAQEICNVPNSPRDNVAEIIKDGGYDIMYEAEKLKNFYKQLD